MTTISILTSTLNAAATFVQTAESIRGQTRSDAIQWLIADGVSTDGTIALIQKNKNLVSYWHSQKDQGIYSAWNSLLPHVSSDWVWCVGADDQLMDVEVVEKLIKLLDALPEEVTWVYGQVNVVGESYSIRMGQPWEEIRHHFFTFMSVPHQGVLVRSEMFKKLGGFNERYRIAGDFEYVVRLVHRGNIPRFIPLLMTNMSIGGVSSQPRQGIRSMWEVAQARIEHNIRPYYPMSWCWLLVKAYGLYVIWRILGEQQTQKCFRAFQLIFDKRARAH